MLKPNDVSVFSTLSINGRMFACPRDQLNALVRENEDQKYGSTLSFETQPYCTSGSINSANFFSFFLERMVTWPEHIYK
jgi:hypothetical protein